MISWTLAMGSAYASPPRAKTTSCDAFACSMADVLPSLVLGQGLLDGLRETIRLKRLDDEVLGAGLDGLQHLGLLTQRRAHDHAGRRVEPDDLAQRLDAVLLGHGDVEGHDVRRQ